MSLIRSLEQNLKQKDREIERLKARLQEVEAHMTMPLVVKDEIVNQTMPNDDIAFDEDASHHDDVDPLDSSHHDNVGDDNPNQMTGDVKLVQYFVHRAKHNRLKEEERKGDQEEEREEIEEREKEERQKEREEEDKERDGEEEGNNENEVKEEEVEEEKIENQVKEDEVEEGKNETEAEEE